ncbi:metal-dependent transcriptional regulator [Aminipila luticellarii]|uniref:DtxR family transcriptional regulator n=1 Tax=Aminipila luticellarii TaxID=2507160 RepID=A0A410PWV5_9FIRM|nr:iron dependent repressor, metal binding and dimerization domain protein [Aminipila luticellarii]QAT43407.1 DtxR family transcriptional regulator [Aminipila luticellarii]
MNNKDFYTVRGYQLLNEKENVLTSSMEDYLEMIYRICSKEGFIRMNELASHLNVRPSSATKLVQKLRSVGFVNYQKYGMIQLTEEGREIGAFLLKRHRIIENFLHTIGVEDTLRDTEMIEHDISPGTLDNLHIFNNFFHENPEILKRYEIYKDQWSQTKKNRG